MPKFSCLAHREINGIEVFLYQMDLNDARERKKIESYIKNKIKKMKMHNNYMENLKYLSPNINIDLVSKCENRIKEIAIPKHSSKKWFDVRRSRVTEFMAELLLEKEQNCIFYDEADKSRYIRFG